MAENTKRDVDQPDWDEVDEKASGAALDSMAGRRLSPTEMERLNRQIDTSLENKDRKEKKVLGAMLEKARDKKVFAEFLERRRKRKVEQQDEG